MQEPAGIHLAGILHRTREWMMKLYHVDLSGHSHRARLFLSLLAIDYEPIEVDLGGGAHRKPEFLKLNRFSEVPVLDDNGTIIADSNAILVYLAKKYGGADWLPEEAKQAANVQRWLSVAAGKVAYGPCAARLVTVFGVKLNAEEAINRSHELLKVLDKELDGVTWIAGTSKPSIADVALYSYIDRAPEGNVDTSSYTNVQAWLRRIEALPRFVPLQKTKAGLQT
jgi:glutathione S-transferase